MEHPPFSVNGLCNLQQLQQTEVYQQYCHHFSRKGEELFETAQQLISQKEVLEIACRKHTVREESAIQSRYLHRGYYCPSPVYDLIVGNARRGRILKRPNAKSKPTHVYGFDSNDRLLWCQNNEQKGKEYLVYEGNRILGISLSVNANFYTISEEIYQNKKLTAVYVAHFHGTHPNNVLLKAELYDYDDLGLCNAKLFEYIPPQKIDPDLKHLPGIELLAQPNCHCIGNYRFTRENDMLVSYRRYGLISDNPIGEEYPVTLPRKA